MPPQLKQKAKSCITHIFWNTFQYYQNIVKKFIFFRWWNEVTKQFKKHKIKLKIHLQQLPCIAVILCEYTADKCILFIYNCLFLCSFCFRFFFILKKNSTMKKKLSSRYISIIQSYFYPFLYSYLIGPSKDSLFQKIIEIPLEITFRQVNFVTRCLYMSSLMI